MKPKHVYLILCVLGFALPYSQFIPWLIANGLHVGYFVQQLFANRIGGFFGLDVLVSAIVLFLCMSCEGKRLRIRQLWAPVVATLAVGVSLGFPLFLYMREIVLERQPMSSVRVSESQKS
jgi:Terpene cyclase DEP1